MSNQIHDPQPGRAEDQPTRQIHLPVFEAGDPGLSEVWEEPETSDVESQHERRPRPSWLEAIRHFSPSWFSIIMGTGVVSILLNRLPYNGVWLYWLSIIVFILNIILFVVALSISTVRYIVWPKIWTIMQRDPQHSLFLGAVPIGFTTIINMIVYVCVPAWGDWVRIMAWALWMVDAAVAATITFLVPYTIMTRNARRELHNINAVQLMPLASTLAASVTGGLVADILRDARHAYWTLITSYALWGVGMLMSSMVLVMYYQRLTLHSLPPREVIVSVFLPVSPASLGSLSILQLGCSSSRIIPRTGMIHSEVGGVVLHVVGCIVSLVLWAYAITWLAYAVGAIVHQKHFPFNLGWWGFTFPLGALALATINLGQELSAEFFKVLGTIFAVMDILIWLGVAVGTVRSLVAGHLLYNSCVKTWEVKEIEKTTQQCSLAQSQGLNGTRGA